MYNMYIQYIKSLRELSCSIVTQGYKNKKKIVYPAISQKLSNYYLVYKHNTANIRR